MQVQLAVGLGSRMCVVYRMLDTTTKEAPTVFVSAHKLKATSYRGAGHYSINFRSLYLTLPMQRHLNTLAVISSVIMQRLCAANEPSNPPIGELSEQRRGGDMLLSNEALQLINVIPSQSVESVLGMVTALV